MEFVISVEPLSDGKTLEVRAASAIERTASGIDSEELEPNLQDRNTVLKSAQARVVL